MALVDHREAQERWARDCQRRDELPRPFGEFLAGLAAWDWFINPISFRNVWRNAHRPPDKPCLKEGPPCPDEAQAYLSEYFADMEKMAGKPIGWSVAEEFGRLGGRYHCHALVTGVAHLRRTFWWAEAFRRFGRTRIEPFDRERGAVFYAAKYAAKQLGGLHFGGTLAGKRLSDFEVSTSSGGKQTVITSAEMPKEFFRMGLGRWHR